MKKTFKIGYSIICRDGEVVKGSLSCAGYHDPEDVDFPDFCKRMIRKATSCEKIISFSLISAISDPYSYPRLGLC